MFPAVPNSILQAPEADYRSRLKRKSIVALDAALECGADDYKRGGIAVQVMRGIGEFQGDTPQIGMVIHLGPPSGWQTTYRTVPDESKEKEEGKPEEDDKP